MVKKSKAKKIETGEAKFPYTTKPGSLRRFLQIITAKPKPPKISMDTLKTWGFKDTNDASILRVLKKIGMLTDGGEPTAVYSNYMKKDSGPIALGEKVMEVYRDLFANVSDPPHASNEDLTNYFNINSGGSEGTIQYQLSTFKALADNSKFDSSGGDRGGVDEAKAPLGNSERSNYSGPGLHIDLHIHLPENKTKSDYDAIFQSIAQHLYKKED
jgi:hypothetical protein